MLSAPLHPPTMNDDDRLIRNMTQAEALELRSILAILLEGDHPPQGNRIWHCRQNPGCGAHPPDPTLQERARAILLGGHPPTEEGEI
jgi:hypothetical protein